jgi:hypothetical protein
VSEYRKIFIRIWADEKFQTLSNDAKILWFYIISCPHGHLSGLFVVDKLYIMGDLRWNSRRLNRAFAEISASGMIIYDEKARLILIKNVLKYDPITNENQAKHVIKHLASLPNSLLISEFCKIALSYTKDEKTLRFLQENTKGFTKPLPRGSGELLGKPLPNSEAVAVTETKAVDLAVSSRAEIHPDDTAADGASLGAPRAASIEEEKGNSADKKLPNVVTAIIAQFPESERGPVETLWRDVKSGIKRPSFAREVLLERGISAFYVTALFP